MSAASLLSTLKEKPTDKQIDEVVHSGHDESSPSGGGDPAVLAMGPVRKPIKYTREELMRLRNSPLVKQGLENAFAGNEALALVLKKRSDSPHEEDKGAKGDAPNENHKGIYGRDRERERRSADPRERVRKESETGGGGIVLSPQRRSFTSGCGAPGASTAQPPPQLARTRPESPLSATTPQTIQKTEQAGRRIGSGRIMVPTSGWEETEYRPTAEIYRPPGALRERERERERDRDRDRERDRDRDRDRDERRTNGDRFERRSFGRDAFSSDMKRERDDRFNNEKHRDRDDNRRSGGRYSQRRFEKEDEPEWFSGGPTSQLETIELHGFDEPIKKPNNSKEKDNEKWNNNNGSHSPVEKWRNDTSSPIQTETANTTSDKDSGVESKPEEPTSSNEQPEFNLDEFLKFDSIPDVLTNGTGDSEESRFSRWFRRDSPTGDAKHYERLMHNMVDDLDNSTQMEAPTSTMNMSGMPMGGMPLNNGVSAMNNIPMPGFPMDQPFNPPSNPPSLLDLLRANPYPDDRPELNSNVGGKIHSLEELEARLRPQPAAHTPVSSDRDLSAFKRLLAQVSGGHAVPADRARTQNLPHPQHPQHQQHPQVPQHNAHPQPMSLLQMLNKSLEKQQQQQQHQQQVQQQQQPPHIPQELLYKLIQVQQRQQQAPNSEMSGPMGLSVADRELLQRPEAQAIIHGLKAGEITVQHLMQQLGNPGLQSRHRDVLLTIMRLHQQQRQQMVGSPLPGVNPHLGVPHHQPLRLSPVPQQVSARIPSPREMIHPQSLMQGALLKKLEERRRLELQQQQIKHPTPISFTPTSVLRKMTAEKESEAPSPKQQWSQPLKLPQGRPIVKGNQSGGAPMGYAPSPSEYQHYMNQQQMGGVRQFPQQASRQPVNNTFNMNMSRGMSGGTTLHQLLVQSHQRSLNEVNSGGGDNQLAKWFSPELLARASEGKLPSVHVPNALSLEDLERHHHSPAPPVRN